jgi:elongation factor Ts
MANISAADVKRLRDLTSAGMMDSKKALEEADGDFDKAVEILRVKGTAKAAKRGAERTASAGLVASSGNALVELNCETDFVAKSDEFVAIAQQVAEAADQAKAGDQETLKGVKLGDSTVGETVESLAAKIGEKIELGRVAVFEGPVVTYMHRRATDLPPAVGVLVEYEGEGEEAARGAAMQIAAMRPQYLSRDEVPADVVAKEREILSAQAAAEGKPAAIVEKMVEGRLRKYLAEICLTGQPFVKDPDTTVGKLLEQAKAGVSGFLRYEVGEGIEKRQENFAAEVMAQVEAAKGRA